MWVYYWVSYWYSVLHWECLPPFRAICFVGPSGQSSTHINVPQGRHVRVCVRAHPHPRTSPSYAWMHANVLPSITDTDIQTHNHSRSRALSRQYSTLDSKPVKRDMCASVCACTESRPPSPPFPSHAHADQTHQTPQDPFFSASTPDSVDFICSKRRADFP